ncbi:MAG: hypothetical protein U0237_17070 [Thermoleophilia bacterium]
MTGQTAPAITLPEDPDLRAVILQAMAAARFDEETSGPAPDVSPSSPPGISARLSSDRACIESNLARKGLWNPGASYGTGIVELIANHDRLGLVERIDPGPPLGGVSFDVLVWACSRWRELGTRDARHIPFTLSGLADDLGWRRGGGAATDLARAVDSLTQATFRARVFNARLREVRIDTFGLLDRWERGERDRPGRSSHTGMLVLGDWLHEQLRRGHVTYVSWRQLRALRGHTARRLLVFLEAERFTGTYRRTVDQALLATLGITATRPHHQRATLRRAAQEISANPNRYQRVAVVPGERRDTYLLVAERVRADQGSSCDARGQSVR